MYLSFLNETKKSLETEEQIREGNVENWSLVKLKIIKGWISSFTFEKFYSCLYGDIWQLEALALDTDLRFQRTMKKWKHISAEGIQLIIIEVFLFSLNVKGNTLPELWRWNRSQELLERDAKPIRFYENNDDPQLENIWCVGDEDIQNFLFAKKALHQTIVDNLKVNFPIIPPKIEIHQSFDMKMLTEIINFERESNLCYCYNTQSSLRTRNFNLFHLSTINKIKVKKKGRIKSQLEYDERIADNVIKTKHPQVSKPFNNSLNLYNERSKNKIIKTKHPDNRQWFINSSSIYDKRLADNIIRTKHCLEACQMNNLINVFTLKSLCKQRETHKEIHPYNRLNSIE
jgi:hypothetical protein